MRTRRRYVRRRKKARVYGPPSAPSGITAIAIDWSGAISGARSKIWLGYADERGLTDLECGRSREEVANHLMALADDNPDIVVGFDFAFSLPAWFLRANNWLSAHEMWQAAALDGERWMRSNPPFWGGMYGRRPAYEAGQNPFRLADLQLKIGGISPKSVFQVGGGGSVGTGSVRGWPILHALRTGGFSVWPFDPPQLPLVVEIYPRILTGEVNKSNAGARADYLARHHPDMPPGLRRKAIASDDAFDAAVSAISMAKSFPALIHLPAVQDPVALLEGIIWHPGLDLDALTQERMT